VSIHTASASSATSQHIADLQHQVTLKSLALQTLQSEYASLLQKLQRERVKSQTIEKKTSVADQEVNELSSRNEDLAEQIKGLETQLEESEKKRESERLTAATERDQWTKLLALDRQLQSKNAEEKQKLREEKSQLSQRVAAYEDENLSRFDEPKRGVSHASATRLDTDKKVDRQESDLTPAATNNVESLKNEIVALNSRIDTLRFALEEAKRRSQRVGEKTQEVVERNADMGASIDRVLKDDAGAKTNRGGPQPQQDPHPSALSAPLSARSTPVRQKPSWSPTTVPTVYPNSSRTLSQSPNPQEPSSTMQSSSSSLSMASIARAVSPGPAELGFHVTPSTSSPEELVAALGPVPPPVQFASGYASGKRGATSTPRKKPRKRNPENSSESSKPAGNVQLASFRPLSHHVPSANNGMGRVVEYVDTLNSYASSPGSMMGGTSPSSSDSTSRRSSEEDETAANLAKVGQSALTAGLPHSELTNGFHPISAMPPPPRPSMSLKDICSIPAGPMVRP
jgi:predicted  nucleic acid-binding Zn-ribbon protein